MFHFHAIQTAEQSPARGRGTHPLNSKATEFARLAGTVFIFTGSPSTNSEGARSWHSTPHLISPA
jgi:hypothetical protein